MAATAALVAIVLINLWLHLALQSVFVRCIWSLCRYFLIDLILFVPSCILYLFVSVIYCFFVRMSYHLDGRRDLLKMVGSTMQIMMR